MKCKTRDFQRSVKHVIGVVEAKPISPIYGMAAITVGDDGSSRISAASVNRVISSSFAHEREDSGGWSAMVPADRLDGIVRGLKSEHMLFSLEPGRLRISSGGSSYALPTLDAGDFPKLHAGDLPSKFFVSGEGARRIFGDPQISAAGDNGRLVGRGVFIHRANDNEVAAAATDGVTLTKTSAKADGEIHGGVIVPWDTANLICKMGAGVDRVGVAFNDKQVVVIAGGVRLQSNLIDAEFPSYANIFPREYTGFIETQRDAFASAIERLESVGGEFKKVSVSWGTSLTMTRRFDGGNGEECLGCSEFGGNGGAMSFSSSKLRRIAAGLEGDTLRIDFFAEAGGQRCAKIATTDRPETQVLLAPLATVGDDGHQ